MEKTPSIVKLPVELVNALASSDKARKFFDTLTPGYRKGYTAWVGAAKQEATRKERARKAIMMLEAGKKTLTTKLD
jgi:uncharacterized protein YdeI (YjbR/CyaY-like superfamily)